MIMSVPDCASMRLPVVTPQSWRNLNGSSRRLWNLPISTPRLIPPTKPSRLPSSISAVCVQLSARFSGYDNVSAIDGEGYGTRLVSARLRLLRARVFDSDCEPGTVESDSLLPGQQPTGRRRYCVARIDREDT